MVDPIEETEYKRKKRRTQQYQQHLTDQEKSATESEKAGSMQGGRKVQKLSKSSTLIANVFHQSIQNLAQKSDEE